MKRISLFIMLIAVLNSCASELKGFEFSNFENTTSWELAKAVRDNNIKLIKEIVKANKVDIDYKDPVNQQTLLTLAIVNRKKGSFIELLKSKASTNILLGRNKDSSPLTEAILHQENCSDVFYIESLLIYGANPNLIIISNDKEHFFFNSFPLIVAIANGVNGDECIDTIRLLVKYGADINYCNPRPINDNICEGVINQCLTLSCMEYLRYFVIEKKIKIPKIVCVKGGGNKSTQQEYSLNGILNTEDYQFEDFIQDNEKVDLSKPRKARNEILEYLKATGQ